MPAVDAIDRADLAADLDLLREAAREAGQIAMRFFRKNPEVWLKGGTSPVSEADYAADRYLHETLLAARPGYGWLSEERADDIVRLKANRTFIVDPIDGTRGFLEGRKEWCISVAVVEAGRPLVGVLECPVMEETYWATLGGGAFRSGHRLAVREPARPLARVGGPGTMISALPDAVRSRVEKSPYVPSLACRIAMVADGTLDATFVKPSARDWDLAAADLILHEAGGVILDEDGVSPRYGGRETAHGHLVAGHGALLAAMAETIKAAS